MQVSANKLGICISANRLVLLFLLVLRLFLLDLLLFLLVLRLFLLDFLLFLLVFLATLLLLVFPLILVVLHCIRIVTLSCRATLVEIGANSLKKLRLRGRSWKSFPAFPKPCCAVPGAYLLIKACSN